MWLMLMVALFASSACDGTECQTGETRCSGATVEVCNGDSRWEDVANCLDVTASAEPSWRCCAVSGPQDAGSLHACLPVSECTEPAQ